MTANARIPIDLCNTKVPLPEAQKVLEEFTADVEQRHFLDEKRRTVYVGTGQRGISHDKWLSPKGKRIDRLPRDTNSGGLVTMDALP